MDPLYFLEHQFLPAVVYPGPDGKQISPFLLGNGFGPLCAGVLKDLPEAGEADGPSFQEADFSAEGLEIRNEHTGLPQCYVLRMHFPSRKAGISIPCVPGLIWSTGSRGKIPGITLWNMMPVPWGTSSAAGTGKETTPITARWKPGKTRNWP